MIIQGRHFPLLLVMMATLLLLGIPSTTAGNAPGAPKVSQVKSIEEAKKGCEDPAKKDISLFLYHNAEGGDAYYSCKEQQEKSIRFSRDANCDPNKDGAYRHPAPFTKVVDGKKYPGIYYACNGSGVTRMLYCRTPKRRNPYQIKGCSNFYTVEELAI
ncbi:hypothetical protein O0I10_009664 [Lichtheimia ornata]|uniref:Uncharacterized protein n=1 Tax=Lichtheimia ornata TaxID=688661 RepID=A0AAD7UWY4_9FUNG|nr:uncharacterized protein O0I10_009664 [Lichtheimia ornata]KAJ8654613.1 hypothetical protein O0I10_009664 [Lichtheimia ornata]